MINFWDFTLEKLEKGISVVLLVVVSAKGSTPGRQGFKMSISADDSQYGTIGGGIMELNFISLAKNLLQTKSEKKFTLKHQVHHKYAPEEEQSGLICSGEEWICFGLLDPNTESIQMIKQVKNDNGPFNQLNVSPTNLFLSENNMDEKEKRYEFSKKSKSEWIFKENLLFKNRLYIFGGGHVGFALSHVFSILDFYITLIDNRANVETITNNTYCNKIIIDDYKNAGNHIEEGETSYIAVVTTSMPTDAVVLESIQSKKVRYLGLMGSKSKKKEIFSQLRKKGVSEDFINKIRCPIGMEKIETHSAEEIAISIAAEILMVYRS